MTNILKAILAIDSNAKCSVYNEDINSIKWTSTPIPKADIEAKMLELQAEYDANQYQRDRATAYPSIQEQLDDLYHKGIDGWKARIKAIKDANPKS